MYYLYKTDCVFSPASMTFVGTCKNENDARQLMLTYPVDSCFLVCCVFCGAHVQVELEVTKYGLSGR